jgi:hypothetical protein
LPHTFRSSAFNPDHAYSSLDMEQYIPPNLVVACGVGQIHKLCKHHIDDICASLKISRATLFRYVKIGTRQSPAPQS